MDGLGRVHRPKRRPGEVPKAETEYRIPTQKAVVYWLKVALVALLVRPDRQRDLLQRAG